MPQSIRRGENFRGFIGIICLYKQHLHPTLFRPQTADQYAVPNYLTNRRINGRVLIEF